MKRTDNYASALKSLIHMTNTKMMYIAKTVDYDISYISKWCNNNNLPLKKNVKSINDRLATLFAEEIVCQGNYDRLCQEFFLPAFTEEKPIDVFKVKETIFEILMVAYRNSEQSISVKEIRCQDKTTIFVGKSKILNTVAETLCSLIESAPDDIELISTIDICKILSGYTLDKVKEYNIPNIRVFASLGLDMKEFESNPNTHFKNLFHFLNKKINCEITLYDNRNFDKFNVLVIKDKIAFLFSMDSDGMMEIAAMITEKEIINKIYREAAEKLKMGDIILKPEEALNLERGGYRTKFYTAPEFRFFSSYGFEFLLPNDIIEDISKKAVEYSGEEEMASFVKKLQITWEERFINGKINFILPKSTVLNYVESGEIFYLDVPFTLSVEQRRRHMRQIVENMKKNPKIQLTILDDDYFYYPEEYFKISVYFNKNKAFLKKNGFALKNNSMRFYVILSEKIIQHMERFFENFVEDSCCTTYSAEEVEEIINQNEKMILRMLNL